MGSVGRPNIVSREDAVSRALDVFWSLGYQRASLPALEKATGLKRGSLYQLFSDKQALFQEALDLYASEALATMDQMMPPGASRDQIVGWITYHANRAFGKAGVRGCLLVEATVEMGPHDPLITEKAAEIFNAMLARLETAIANAPDLQDAHPKETARTVLAFLEGLRVLGKNGQSKTQVNSAVDRLTSSLLGPQPTE